MDDRQFENFDFTLFCGRLGFNQFRYCLFDQVQISRNKQTVIRMLKLFISVEPLQEVQVSI